jgi:Mg2+/citrate symporter
MPQVFGFAVLPCVGFISIVVLLTVVLTQKVSSLAALIFVAFGAALFAGHGR